MVEEGFDWPIKGFLVNGVPRLTQEGVAGGGGGGGGGGEMTENEKQSLATDEEILPSRLYVLPMGANPSVDKAVAFVPEDGNRLWKELVKGQFRFVRRTKGPIFIQFRPFFILK